MNAPEKINTLRAEIGQYLARVGEATAKDVADAVLHEKLAVVRALNDMRQDVEVEREKKRGNEYVYWLVAEAKVPTSKAEAKPAVCESVQTAVVEQTDTPAAIDAQRAEFTILQVIADIRAAIGDKEGRIMLGELAEHIKTIYEQRLAALDVIKVWEHNMQQAISANEPISAAGAIRTLRQERDDLRTRLDDVQQRWQADVDLLTGKNHKLHEELEALRTELAAERQAREALQEQDDGVDVTVAAIGYLVRATKRKPRYITKPERAREAALSAVRAGAGRADVLAVVPVGSARRGAEWRTD